jgi:hypothetical protein
MAKSVAACNMRQGECHGLPEMADDALQAAHSKNPKPHHAVEKSATIPDSNIWLLDQLQDCERIAVFMLTHRHRSHTACSSCRGRAVPSSHCVLQSGGLQAGLSHACTLLAAAVASNKHCNDPSL